MTGTQDFDSIETTGIGEIDGDDAELMRIHERLRTAWQREGGLPVGRRIAILQALRASLLRDAETYSKAISADFGIRSRHETLLTEIVMLIQAIDYTVPRIKRWSAATRVTLGLPFWPASSRILKQPRGVVGLIGPSNYPLQLVLMPLISAVAAGCRVILKPSEMTPCTAAAIKTGLQAAIADDVVGVALGGADISAAITRLPLDALLFTGSETVGRKVIAAAAAQLTPVILELGGKSPVIVDASADLREAATSIIAGKLLNAGQTCIAPDYVLVPAHRTEALIIQLKAAAAAMYPDDKDYSAVRSEAAHDRLKRLGTDHQLIPLLARSFEAPRHAPALVLSPPLDSAIMREEIFGPLLPIVPYDTLDDAIAIICDRPAPLVIYWFGSDQSHLKRVLNNTRSGAVSANETVIHAGVPALPFGGIGASGMGRYHGKAGFDTFTHERPVFRQARWTLTKMLRPPFGASADRILARLLR